MAYDRHIWTNNESITYQKLNTIEDAVSELNSPSSSRAITVNGTFVSLDDGYAWYELDKTWNEIYSYILEGNYVVIVVNDSTYNLLFSTPVLSVDEYLPNYGDNWWSIKCKNFTWFTYEGADSYPVGNFYID